MSSANKERVSPSLKKTFTNKEKIRIVIEGQSNARPIEELCSMEGINNDTFNKWTKEFLSGSNSTIDEVKVAIGERLLPGNTGAG